MSSVFDDFKRVLTNVKLSSEAAAKRLLGDLNKEEKTSSKSLDYIIIEGTNVITYDQAEALVRIAQEQGKSVEDQSVAVTVNYMETVIKEQADKDPQDTNPYYVLYQSYLAFKAKELPVEKFKILTSKINTSLGTEGSAKTPPFQQLAKERDSVDKARTKGLSIPGHKDVKSGVSARKLFNANYLGQIANEFWDSNVTGSSRLAYYLEVRDKDNAPSAITLIKVVLNWKRAEATEQDKTKGIINPVLTFENYDKSLPRNASKEYTFLNAGHWMARKMQTSNIQEKYEIVKNLVDSGINPRTNGPLSPEHKLWLQSQLAKAKGAVSTASGIDKIFGSFNLANRSVSKTEWSAEYLIKPFLEIAANLGSKQILIVEDAQGSEVTLPSGTVLKNVKYRVVDLLIDYSAEVQSYAEFANFNSMKGGTQSSLIDNAEKLFKEIIESMLEGRILTTSSPSLFTQALAIHLFQALAPLLDRKELGKLRRLVSEKIPKKKRVLASHRFLTKPKLVDINRVTKAIKEERNEVIQNFKAINANLKSIIKKEEKAGQKGVAKARSISSPKKRLIEDDTTNNFLIVANINRDIKSYVIEQMVSPSLVNRSGTFAGSVAITNISADRSTISYTYKDNPYDLFSSDRGKDPWNRIAARDPNLIIEKAITAMARQKYAGVFRDPLTIVKG